MLPVYYLVVAIYINSLKLIFQYRAIRELLFFSVITLLMYALLFFTFNFNLASFIIYFPPVLISGWIAFIFLFSLKAEKSTIFRLAERMEEGASDSRHLHYTRQLTALWGVVLLWMVGEALLLARWATFEIWSWWVHVGNYCIVGTLFIIEMFVRHHFTGKRAQVVKMFSVMLTRNGRDR